MNEVDMDAQLDFNFFNIVISLSQAAVVGMGKVTNPQTGSVEKNMELAKVNIDILQMLKNKTKGNLTKKEDELLSDTLANLQLTYADEAKKDTEKKEPEKEDKKEENAEKTEEKSEESEKKE